MEDGFYLIIHFVPETNTEPLGQFYLGPSSEFANTFFDMLKGEEELKNYCFLFLELVEYRQGLPINLLIKNCTLEQLGENCKFITKEIFKRTTFESDHK